VEELLRLSELLSLHAPSTPETRHLLDARRLALLPRGAIVVNTARGDLVDDEALISALRSGQVGAAGLDVFQGEPVLHPGYRSLENAFLLPHMGSATIETREAMGFRALDNVDAALSGRPAPDRVA
jgi:lactate dehydrogenase-like 2-hydroxyacid dehydrogenase